MVPYVAMASPTGSCSSLWILEKLMDIPNQPPGGSIRPDERYVLSFEDDGETLVVMREPRNQQDSLQSSREELSTSLATTPEAFNTIDAPTNTTKVMVEPHLSLKNGIDELSNLSSYASTPVESHASLNSSKLRSEPEFFGSFTQRTAHSELVLDIDDEIEYTPGGRHHYQKRRNTCPPETPPDALKGSSLPVEVGHRDPLRGSFRKNLKKKDTNNLSKRRSLPSIFGKWAQRLSFRKKSSKSKRRSPPRGKDTIEQTVSSVARKEVHSESVTSGSSSCVTQMSEGKDMNLPSSCSTCGKSLEQSRIESFPSVHVQDGAAARMSQWWLEQRSPCLAPKFGDVGSRSHGSYLDGGVVYRNSKHVKHLRQNRSKRNSLPMISPKPKSYPRPLSFHGDLSGCSCQSSAINVPSNKGKCQKDGSNRPLSWAGPQIVQSNNNHNQSLNSTPSAEILKGRICANTINEVTCEGPDTLDQVSSTSLRLEEQLAIDDEKSPRCKNNVNDSLKHRQDTDSREIDSDITNDDCIQERKLSSSNNSGHDTTSVTEECKGRSDISAMGGTKHLAMEARTRHRDSGIDIIENLHQEEVSSQQAAAEAKLNTTSDSIEIKGAVDKPKDPWILQPQELCQKLEQVQQERSVCESQWKACLEEDDQRDTEFEEDLKDSSKVGVSLSKDEESLRDIGGDKMRPLESEKRIISLVTGEISQIRPEFSLDQSVSSVMEHRPALQETDIDLYSETNAKPDLSNLSSSYDHHLEVKKQLDIANRIIQTPEVKGGRNEENNNRKSSGHQRKSSLVLALEDGPVKMNDETVRPLDIESDINVIAQLNQLNSQLGELNQKSHHSSDWDFRNKRREKPALVKSNSISSTTSIGLSSDTMSSSVPLLTRSGSESHMQKKHKIPLDVRPSSIAGRGSSSSKLTRQRSKEKCNSSSEENSQSTSPQKKPKMKPSLILSIEGDKTEVKGAENKVSSPTFVSRLKNKILSPKSSSPAKSLPKGESEIVGNEGEQSNSELDQIGAKVPLRKESPGRKGDGVRITWPFSSRGSQSESEADGEGKRASLKEKKRKVGMSEVEDSLIVATDESHDTGSSDSGMEKDWNSKSNDDLAAEEVSAETRKATASSVSSTESSQPASRPQSLCTRYHLYPVSAPMSPYRTPCSSSREDILEGKNVPQSLPMSPQCRSMESILDAEGQKGDGEVVGRPPKPTHRPKRRSRSDLPTDFKTILSELKETAREAENTSEVIRRRKGVAQRRPLSAYGKLGHISTDGTPEKSPTSPLAKLEQRRSSSYDTLQLTEESPEKLPRSQSLTMLNEIAQPPSNINKILSLPTGLGEDVELLRHKPRYRRIHVKSRSRLSECYDQESMPVFAEAIWDHVSMDESELVFHVGNVIEITDTTDDNWWWGHISNREGWVRVGYVRLRVGQGETIEDCIERLSQKTLRNVKKHATDKQRKGHMRKISLNLMSNDQVRANVVREILTTEKDYVKLLQDICEGFISQARNKEDLFSKQQLTVIFGNIEEIYSFHQHFLSSLEQVIDQDMPHLSEVGECFLRHQTKFQLYSEYCNNYPLAITELKGLYKKPRVRHFLEECRIQQNMIKITLDGFLLTPVQKICKYPLQLNELLKYTKPVHADYLKLKDAFQMMRETALDINEKKRRVENVQKMAEWQRSIADWEGGDLLEKSSSLIHSGDVHRMTNRGKFVLRRLFLFDHQLIICKKDLLKRNGFVFKGRLDTKEYTATSLEEGKDSPAFSWRLTHREDDSQTLTFVSRNKDDKTAWMKAFEEERRCVAELEKTGECRIVHSHTVQSLLRPFPDEDTPRKKILTALIGLGGKK